MAKEFADLIDTLWNVKEGKKFTKQQRCSDLIDTLWNVKAGDRLGSSRDGV